MAFSISGSGYAVCDALCSLHRRHRCRPPSARQRVSTAFRSHRSSTRRPGAGRRRSRQRRLQAKGVGSNLRLSAGLHACRAGVRRGSGELELQQVQLGEKNFGY